MIPVLFPAAETAFSDVSRVLTDTVKCTVRQAVRGYDELSLQYPMIGAHFAELVPDALILAKPNAYTRAQPYRIYNISRPVNGLVTVSARHIAYDGRGIPIKPFKATTASDAASKLKTNAAVTCPFNLTTDINKTKDMEVTVPKTLRELVATDKDSWLGTYGGGLVFDFYTISLLQNPGSDRGVTIRYGVDLTDAQQEENIADMITGVLPFWQGNQETVTPSQTADVDDTIEQTEVTIVGTVQRAAGTFPVEKIKPLDLSEYWDEPPSAAQLNSMANDWMSANKVGVPVVSLRVSYAALGQDVRLYDTVRVEFPLLGISTASSVSAAEFDVLREICTNVEIGDVQTQITDSMTDAGRLKKGKLLKQRIANNSIGGSMMSSGGISARALEAYAVTKDKLAALAVSTSKLQQSAVTVNKIGNGAVSTEKILDGAVTGIKVLDNAIEYAKLGEDVQILFTDILAAQAIFAGFLKADGSVEAEVVSISNYLSINGTIYEPKTYTVKDTHVIVNMSGNYNVATSPVYDWNDVQIGQTPDVYFTYAISNGGTETNTTYNLRVLGPRDMN